MTESASAEAEIGGVWSSPGERLLLMAGIASTPALVGLLWPPRFPEWLALQSASIYFVVSSSILTRLSLPESLMAWVAAGGLLLVQTVCAARIARSQLGMGLALQVGLTIIHWAFAARVLSMGHD